MKRIIASVFVLSAIFWFGSSANALAATVYLESSRNSISVGDTVIVSVKINAEGTTINTVDGEVAIKSGASNVGVKEFSLANSSFGLWPRTPSLSVDGQVVSFVGGVPGGFNIEGATLFKVIFEAKKEGTVTIAPRNVIVFANDGKGTKLPVQLKSLALNVVANKTGATAVDEWGSLVAEDLTPPEDFIIVMGQDKAMLDGKKFAFFSALDNQSGVSHYEVSENGSASVRSGSTYVLSDQEGKVKLNVTAFDKAGNKKTAAYDAAATKTDISWISVIGAVILILVVRMIYRMRRARKNNASSQI